MSASLQTMWPASVLSMLRRRAALLHPAISTREPRPPSPLLSLQSRFSRSLPRRQGSDGTSRSLLVVLRRERARGHVCVLSRSPRRENGTVWGQARTQTSLAVGNAGGGRAGCSGPSGGRCAAARGEWAAVGARVELPLSEETGELRNREEIETDVYDPFKKRIMRAHKTPEFDRISVDNICSYPLWKESTAHGYRIAHHILCIQGICTTDIDTAYSEMRIRPWSAEHICRIQCGIATTSTKAVHSR